MYWAVLHGGQNVESWVADGWRVWPQWRAVCGRRGSWFSGGCSSGVKGFGYGEVGKVEQETGDGGVEGMLSLRTVTAVAVGTRSTVLYSNVSEYVECVV